MLEEHWAHTLRCIIEELEGDSCQDGVTGELSEDNACKATHRCKQRSVGCNLQQNTEEGWAHKLGCIVDKA